MRLLLACIFLFASLSRVTGKDFQWFLGPGGDGTSFADNHNWYDLDPAADPHNPAGPPASGDTADLISANDDWQADPALATQLRFLELAPTDPKESAIYTSLPPGAFTAILAGKDGGTGIGLVEIYNVQ